MKTLRNSLAWIILAANVLMLCALSTQVLRLPGGTAVMFKPQLTLAGTYIDARAWSADDWSHHPELVQRVEDAGKKDLLPSQPSEAAQQTVVKATVHAALPAQVTAAPVPVAPTAHVVPQADVPSQPQPNIFQDSH